MKMQRFFIHGSTLAGSPHGQLIAAYFLHRSLVICFFVMVIVLCLARIASAATEREIQELKQEAQAARDELVKIEENEKKAEQQAQQTLRQTFPGQVSENLIAGWKVLVFYSLKGLSLAAMVADPVNFAKSLLTGYALDEMQFSKEELAFLEKKKLAFEEIKQERARVDGEIKKVVQRQDAASKCMDTNKPALAELDLQIKSLIALDQKAVELEKKISGLKQTVDSIAKELTEAGKQAGEAEQAAKQADEKMQQFGKSESANQAAYKQCAVAESVRQRIADESQKAIQKGQFATAVYDSIEKQVGRSCTAPLIAPRPTKPPDVVHRWEIEENAARARKAQSLGHEYSKAKRAAAEALVEAAKAEGSNNRLNKIIEEAKQTKTRLAEQAKLEASIGSLRKDISKKSKASADARSQVAS